MTHSVFAAKARPPSASVTKSTSKRENRRIILIGGNTIYAGDENPQVEVGAVHRIASVCASYSAGRLRSIALPLRVDFVAHQIFDGLSFSNERELVATHKRFSWQRPRIIIRGHHKPVSTRAHDREQIAFAQFRHFAIERKKITALANRADYVDRLRLIPSCGVRRGGRPTTRFLNRHNLMITVVKRRPNQIVHARIDNREFLLTGALDITDPRQQNAGISNEQPPRLKQNLQLQFAQRRQDCIDILLDRQALALVRSRIPPFLLAALE